MDTHLLLAYLDARRAPLSPDAVATHRSLCEASPERYLAFLTDPAATVAHKREVLANLLRVPAARAIPSVRIRSALADLPPSQLLQVLDVLPARRINSRRARTLLLALLLGHPQLASLAATHRQRLVRLLRHALGERMWSGVGRHLANPTPAGDALLDRKLLRYASDAVVAREALCFLAGVENAPSDPLMAKSRAARKDIEAGAGLPRETLFGLRGIYHRDVPASRIRVLAAVAQGATRADGPLTALYKDALLDSGAGDTLAALAGHVQAAVGTLPEIDAHAAVVLDLSASAASSGERAYHPAALGLALTRILQSRVRRVSLHLVGAAASADDAPDGGDLPRPQGVTDLASAMLVAAREASGVPGVPGVMLVITDGYENTRPGDAARVAEGLSRLVGEIAVYQVVPLFAAGEDLTQRRLGAPIQTIPVTHEGDVRELLARILLASRGPVLQPEEDALVRELVVAG